MSSRLAIRSFVAAAAGAGALVAAAPASAEQFVVAHATYTHSAETTKDSHYRVKPTAETPLNWTSPVDYAGGSVHVRLEVKTKPSDAPTRYQICFEMKQNYCCTDQAPPYTTTGVYEWDTDVATMWRPGPVDFSQGILQSALILKDTNNVKPAPENVGDATSKLYMPSDLDVTVTVVAAGSEFMPPAEPVGGSGGMGGGGAAGAAGTGGMAVAGGGGGGVPASAGMGGTGGSAGTTPEPAAGMAPTVPTPTAGTGPALLSGTGTGDEGSCAFGTRGGGSSSAWFGFALGLALLRSARRRRT